MTVARVLSEVSGPRTTSTRGVRAAGIRNRNQKMGPDTSIPTAGGRRDFCNPEGRCIGGEDGCFWGRAIHFVKGLLFDLDILIYRLDHQIGGLYSILYVCFRGNMG